MDTIQQIIMDDDLEDDIVEDAESVAPDTECKSVDSDALQAEIKMSWNHSLLKQNRLALIPNQKSCFRPGARFCTACRNGGCKKSHHLHGVDANSTVPCTFSGKQWLLRKSSNL